ncbi:branched-chain amino acid ABC transporter substrate-binding protein [Psychrobacter sp.]|uniref:branched-chain amino acid ABC transporter substrate-binding protein n=1 Tax=Psychrobacter sp. TaxID=56811 RepID=UPI0025CB7DBF|nr:branched-chain amino acid ABC transporter substrate-binding protein [Psychrobacter sp.]
MNMLIKLLPITFAIGLAACNGGDPKTGGTAEGSTDTAKNAGCEGLTADQVCVLIGSGAPKTGGIAHLGKDIENGTQLAINEINAKNDLTIDGKKVKLGMVGEDDAGDPRQGTIAAQKIVDTGAVGVIGHLNSGVSIPANAIYARAGMVQISPASTNPDYTLKGNKTPKGAVSSYRVVATDAQQGPALAHYMLENGAKSVAVLDDATQYGKGLADQVAQTLTESGANVSTREATTDKTTDFKAVLTKIKATNPQFIFWGGMDDTGATLAKQMRELGITAVLVGADGACTDKFIELSGAAGKGVICSQAGMPLSQMAKGSEFSANYEKAFSGQKVQIYSPFSYDATYVLVEAMKLANSTDREAIAAAMPKVQYNGLIGPIAFDEKGDIKNGSISLYKVGDKLDVIKVVK